MATDSQLARIRAGILLREDSKRRRAAVAKARLAIKLREIEDRTAKVEQTAKRSELQRRYAYYAMQQEALVNLYTAAAVDAGLA